jgi:hypothetical protein
MAVRQRKTKWLTKKLVATVTRIATKAMAAKSTRSP